MESDLNPMHNLFWYTMALEHGNYRAACVEAVRAVRRCRKGTDPRALQRWEMRLRGAFERRHR